MLVSAEIRWFWPGNCPQPIHDWFFTTGLPPGGGQPRIDRYLAQPDQAEIGVKARAGVPGLEIKGLVATRYDPTLSASAPHFEIWCKWSCPVAGLNLTDEVAVTKTRWLRQFDTSKPVRVEVPLDANEKQKSGYPFPVQGCNVELTEVSIIGRQDAWWTLGFEAFGDLDTAPINLARTILPEMSELAGMVSSGALSSYPAWLSARLADQARRG